MRYVPISYGASRISTAPSSTSGGAAVRTMSSPVLPRARSPSRRSTARASTAARPKRSVPDAGSREGLNSRATMLPSGPGAQRRRLHRRVAVDRIEGAGSARPVRLHGGDSHSRIARAARQERHVPAERHHAVAVLARADALRARRRERGSRVSLALREVAAREPTHRAQQRDRDRPSVVKHGVFAKAVDADSETAASRLRRRRGRVRARSAVGCSIHPRARATRVSRSSHGERRARTVRQRRVPVSHRTRSR